MIRRVGVNLDKQYKNIQRMKRSPIPKSELDYGYDCDYVEESGGYDYSNSDFKSDNTYNKYDDKENCCQQLNLKNYLYATIGVLAVAAITKLCMDSYEDRRRHSWF